MSSVYYKAVRPDGTSFWDPTFRWVPETGPVEGIVVEHPNPHGHVGAAGYLSVATVATDCTGMGWPCRLLEVESVEGRKVHTPDRTSLPNKRASAAWRVVRELPAHLTLGPQREHVSTLLARVRCLAVDERRRLASWDAAEDADWIAAWRAAGDAARYAAWRAAGDAARRAAGDAAGDAARDAAGDAAGDAAWALIVRDLITTAQFDTLTAPMRAAGINFDALTGGRP